MGTLPIECGGELVRLALQKGGVRRNSTQADDPGAPRGCWSKPDYNPGLPALLALNQPPVRLLNISPFAQT